jgi:perosamine synthetase
VSKFLPYGRQAIDEQDIAAVVAALRSELITQGPRVEQFEQAFAAACGAEYAVAFANGTAALHGAAVAAGIRPGERVLTTPISFVASSNCVLYAGGHPVFGDIDPATLNLDCDAAVRAGRCDDIRAVVAVSLTGLPVDLTALQPLREVGVCVIEDAAHALGALRGGLPVGGDGLADMTAFSLHPVKAITSGEGGVITTDDPRLADRLRTFRTHGIERDSQQTPAYPGPWHYDVRSLGFNYRITDFQCALGISQLDKLERFIEQRNQVATWYREQLADIAGLALPPAASPDGRHAYHLFVVRFDEGADRRRIVCEGLRAVGIGTQLHYIPIYRHSLYRSLGYDRVDAELPHAERYYASALSLPIFPELSERDVQRVASELRRLMAVEQTPEKPAPTAAQHA